MRRAALVRYAAAASALAVIGTLGAIVVATRNEGRAARSTGTSAAEQLYAIALQDADGHAQPLAQWRGQYLVVNFWATWCAPCTEEMPDLDRAQREYSGRNVALIGIGIESQDRVREFRDRLGLRMTLLAGGYQAMSLARAFGDNQGVLPYTALLSTDGRVLHSRTGKLRPGELRQWLSVIP